MAKMTSDFIPSFKELSKIGTHWHSMTSERHTQTPSTGSRHVRPAVCLLGPPANYAFFSSPFYAYALWIRNMSLMLSMLSLDSTTKKKKKKMLPNFVWTKLKHHLPTERQSLSGSITHWQDCHIVKYQNFFLFFYHILAKWSFKYQLIPKGVWVGIKLHKGGWEFQWVQPKCQLTFCKSSF